MNLFFIFFIVSSFFTLTFVISIILNHLQKDKIRFYTQWQTDKQRQTDRLTVWEKDKQRQTGRQTGRRTGWETDRQGYRQTGGDTDGLRDLTCWETDRQLDGCRDNRHFRCPVFRRSKNWLRVSDEYFHVAQTVCSYFCFYLVLLTLLVSVVFAHFLTFVFAFPLLVTFVFNSSLLCLYIIFVVTLQSHCCLCIVISLSKTVFTLYFIAFSLFRLWLCSVFTFDFTLERNIFSWQSSSSNIQRPWRICSPRTLRNLFPDLRWVQLLPVRQCWNHTVNTSVEFRSKFRFVKGQFSD